VVTSNSHKNSRPTTYSSTRYAPNWREIDLVVVLGMPERVGNVHV